MLLLDIGLLIVGLVILIFGGDFLVRGASNIAYKAQLSPMVVGLTIVAFGTSAPELMVSLNAVADNPGISIGNVVGSNICNLALILGVMAAITPVKVKFGDIKIDWFMCLGSGLLLYFFLNGDHRLTAFEGFILFLIVLTYTYYLIEMSRKETKDKSLEEVLDEETKEELEKAMSSNTWVEIGFVVLGIVMLYFGGDYFVQGAVNIAKMFSVSDEIIGLTVIAMGTSAPELITSVIAARQKNTDMAVGNLLGSNIFNVLSILGVTSMVKSITVIDDILNFDMLIMLGVTLIILPMVLSRNRISPFEGVILIAVYLCYTTYKVLEVMQVVIF